MSKIQDWNAVRARFTDGLILGNGASVAVSEKLSYPSLYDQAQKAGALTEPVVKVFEAFGVKDFEVVLRRLWQATTVNRALGIQSEKLQTAYNEVREALITTVHSVHPSYDEAKSHFESAANFMRGFKTVASLNYDLIVYWAALWANEQMKAVWFKDAFIKGHFRADWSGFRVPYKAVGGATLFFYPHGNLCLGRFADGTERKLGAGGADLLQTIVDAWRSDEAVPLFVCEGTSNHKLQAVGGSQYLQHVYLEVLRDFQESVTFYGWSFSEQDVHVLDRIAQSSAHKAAVAVHGENGELVDRAEKLLKERNFNEIVFFDAQSTGAWNTK